MRGIVTIACGRSKYLAWAGALARSLAIHYPDCPRHLITDRPDHPSARLFSTCAPPADGESGMAAKMRLEQLSPYDETLFLDADTIVFRSLNTIFERLSQQDFSLLGRAIKTGQWYFDVPTVLRQIDRSSISQFNSGILYFRRGEIAERVFARAREVSMETERYGINDPQGRPADEPCFSIAMGIEGVPALAYDSTLYTTPLAHEGKLTLDPLRGICRFDSPGHSVSPGILHFVSLTKHRSYASCRYKLWLREFPMPSIVRYLFSDALAFLWSAGGKLGLLDN